MHFVASTVKLVKCLKEGEEDTFPLGQGKPTEDSLGALRKMCPSSCPLMVLVGSLGSPSRVMDLPVRVFIRICTPSLR